MGFFLFFLWGLAWSGHGNHSKCSFTVFWRLQLGTHVRGVAKKNEMTDVIMKARDAKKD